MNLNGKLIIDVVYNRARRAGFDELIILTSDAPASDTLVAHCEKMQYSVFRGPENDVLTRFLAAVELSESDVFVRLNGDNPFIDPALLIEMRDYWLDYCTTGRSLDYFSNILQDTFPIGMHVEFISRAACKKLALMALEPEYREHITPGIYLYPEVFKIVNHSFSGSSVLKVPEIRLTIDYPEDLEFAESLVAESGKDIEDLSLDDIIATLIAFPGLLSINGHLQKSQRYQPRIKRTYQSFY